MIVINGTKYIPLYKVKTARTVTQWNQNKTEYAYTVCYKNACAISRLYTGVEISNNNSIIRLVSIGDYKDNVIWYDEIEKKVITQDVCIERWGWRASLSTGDAFNVDPSSISCNFNFFLGNINPSFSGFTSKNAKVKANFSSYGSYFNTSIFNYLSYTESQLFPLLTDVYYVTSRTTTSRAEYEKIDDILFESVGCTTNSNLQSMVDYISLWYRNSVLNGKLKTDIDNTVFSVDWTVYIDGTYNPTIKITWDSDYMNYNDTGNTFDASKVFIGYGSESPFNVDWESGSFTTSYKEVIKVLYPSWYEKIIEGVGSMLDAPSFSIRLLGATLNGGVQVNSGTCFFVLSSNGNVSESGLAEGSEGLKDTITIVYGNSPSGGSDEDSDEPSEQDTPSEGEELTEKGLNLLTLTYALTPTRLAQLGSFIWGASFLDNLKLVNNNPIENIVSCKMFPFTVNGSSDTSIMLGNVSTGVNGNPVSSGGYSAKRVINGFTINPLFNNFLDYEPYTKISVFLPFIGIKELQPSQIMNKTLSLEYITDIVTGVCKCIVKSGGKQIADYDGSIGIDIPITSSNRAQVELSYITSALGVVGSVAMGSPLGVVGSVLSGASSSYHSETKGTSSPTTGVYGALTPFVIFDRPKYTLPYAYGKTKGFVCNKTLSIGSVKGFTVCHENVNLSGISCTSEELEEIKGLLTSGFFA